MIYLLVRIKSLVKVVLACCMSPKYLPIVSICLSKIVRFKQITNKLRLTLQHLEVACALTLVLVFWLVCEVILRVANALYLLHHLVCVIFQNLFFLFLFLKFLIDFRKFKCDKLSISFRFFTF